MHAKSLMCPTLLDPMDRVQPGYSVYGFSMQEYLSDLPFPPPGNLGIESSPLMFCIEREVLIISDTWEVQLWIYIYIYMIHISWIIGNMNTTPCVNLE